ncbi:ABC transporter substrate-binding protein [Aeromicrobium choanae]|uniref:ABC-type branched-chain amino acid transport system, substrate-binding protein n=1 Tax=Aeromicrobium choanae TaxID=1736691 RepID=A0A1T4YWF4_9ACTN|nr:ABC transporter substrate-binding protein [Aeromicrobium choanae]SKB06112.1 ABC-type branched-chain amino acid transport system, substrate-binding protein [Aeromicrobium choanae]
MKNTSTRRFRAATAAAALALLVAACGGGSDDEAAEGDGTYKWGINAELSGVTAYYGEGMEVGLESYVEEVNAAGGINGHEIELVTLDNGADASRTATNTTQLATAEEVSAIFGFVLSANCSAGTPVAERYKVPLACMSLAESNDYAFSLGADNTRAGSAMIAAAKEVSGQQNPRAALVNINTLTSIGFGDQVEEKAAAEGVELVTRQEIDLAASDSSTQIAKLVAARPDVVMMSNTGPGFLSVLKGLRSAKIDAPIIWVDGTGNLPSLAESTDEGVYALTVAEVVDPAKAEGAAAEFLKSVGSRMKSDNLLQVNGAYTVPAYMTARLFGAAMETCGYPCSGEDLRKELEKTSIELPGLASEFGYAEGDHYPYAQWHLYQITGEQVSHVESFESD